MCSYFLRIAAAIQAVPGQKLRFVRVYLELARNGGIKYTKYSQNTGRPYSKVIPVNTICIADQIRNAHGMNSINRTWHNNLPEGKDKPCNLKVIEEILNKFH